MGGEISLDNDYDSGVPGCIGTRIVVDLITEPIDSNHLHEYDSSWHELDHEADSGETAGLTLSEDEESFRPEQTLPEKLSVLFVDDDAILRKLFMRTVLTVAPHWDIREASNGETALRLVDSHHFDLIFMDMYMASVQKQLLGTEAVKALRAKGVTCRICGLSANDKGKEFLKAGADAFTYKPFPCAPRPLTNELCRILYSNPEPSEAGDPLSASENGHLSNNGSHGEVVAV
jgi:CheY-like chemotaxis protein